MSEFFYTGSRDNVVRKHKTTTGDVVATYTDGGGNDPRTMAINPNGLELYVLFSDGDIHVLDTSDLSLIKEFNVSISSSAGGAYSDGFFYVTGFSKNVDQVDIVNETKTSFTAPSSDTQRVVIGDDGFIYAGDKGGFVWKIDPETMSDAGSIDVSADVGGLIYYDGHVYAASGSSTARLAKIDTATMSLVSSSSDSIFNTIVGGGQVGGELFFVRGLSSGHVLKVDSSSLSTLDTLNASRGSPPGIVISSSLIVEGGVSGNVSVVRPADLSIVATDSTATDLLFSMAAVPESGPTTDEEIFQATYANASAAPPKRTALVRPLDVQRSIDTDVSWLSQNPKEWTLDVIISVGELQHYRPGNLFFVRADVPGLRAGRKVLLKGFSASDIRPTEPVTCVFTAPSETA